MVQEPFGTAVKIPDWSGSFFCQSALKTKISLSRLTFELIFRDGFFSSPDGSFGPFGRFRAGQVVDLCSEVVNKTGLNNKSFSHDGFLCSLQKPYITRRRGAAPLSAAEQAAWQDSMDSAIHFACPAVVVAEPAAAPAAAPSEVDVLKAELAAARAQLYAMQEQKPAAGASGPSIPRPSWRDWRRHA